jgi:hypothetical protein
MDQIVLTPEELLVLKDLNTKKNILSNNFKELEEEYQAKKQYLQYQLKIIDTSCEKMGVLLHQKYGDGIIDPDTGIFKKSTLENS